MIKEGLSGRCHVRPECPEGVSCLKTWGNGVPGRGDSNGKGTERALHWGLQDQGGELKDRKGGRQGTGLEGQVGIHHTGPGGGVRNWGFIPKRKEGFQKGY